MSRHRELMRLYDGELEPEEAAELERSLSPEDRAVLDGLAELGDSLRELGERRGQAAGDIAGAVMARLDEPAGGRGAGPSSTGGRSVVSMVGRRAGPAPVLVIGLALAAAAAAVVWLNRPQSEAEAPAERLASAVVAPAPARPVTPPAPQPVEEVEPELGPAASIEAVDFGSQPGTIFLVPAGQETTPVVWLVDDPDQGGGRMEPL